jgi:sortase A
VKKHLPTIIVAIIFICGLSLFLYPTVSNLYNQHINNKLIGDYKESFEDTTPEELNKAMKDAVAFNQNRGDEKKLKELGLTYESVLNAADNGVMGYIEIPSLSVSLPVYHTVNEDILQVAVGDLEWSDLPVGGEGTHCVLSGHRGLPSAKLFTDLDDLRVGDTFMLRILDGLMTYEVDQILIVDPDDVKDLKQVPGQDLCTLVTCTPYGVNTHRLLVRGHRVENTPEAVIVRVTANAVPLDPLIVSVVVAVPMMILAITILINGSSRSSRKRRSERRYP